VCIQGFLTSSFLFTNVKGRKMANGHQVELKNYHRMLSEDEYTRGGNFSVSIPMMVCEDDNPLAYQNDSGIYPQSCQIACSRDQLLCSATSWLTSTHFYHSRSTREIAAYTIEQTLILLSPSDQNCPTV